jgi:VanZ family protein
MYQTMPVSERPAVNFFLPKGLLWFSTWGSVVGYCAVLFVLSAQPDLQVPSPFPLSDKLVHFFLYAGLGWLWARAVKWSLPEWSIHKILFMTLLFTGGYGFSDEWHQSYVPGRFAELQDVVADAVGGIVGGYCYLLWRQKRRTGNEEEQGQRK